jgi:hypothetical protein
VAATNPAGILAQVHVANAMQAVLDAPVAPIRFQKTPGVGLFRAQASDAVGRFGTPAPAVPTLAGDVINLGQARPTPPR